MLSATIACSNGLNDEPGRTTGLWCAREKRNSRRILQVTQLNLHTIPRHRSSTRSWLLTVCHFRNCKNQRRAAWLTADWVSLSKTADSIRAATYRITRRITSRSRVWRPLTWRSWRASPLPSEDHSSRNLMMSTTDGIGAVVLIPTVNGPFPAVEVSDYIVMDRCYCLSCCWCSGGHGILSHTSTRDYVACGL